jgi:hypothetical protein
MIGGKEASDKYHKQEKNRDSLASRDPQAQKIE